PQFLCDDWPEPPAHCSRSRRTRRPSARGADGHAQPATSLNPNGGRRASQWKAMIQDFRFALRQLIKSPGFTAIAVITIALAIGVNAAMFAIVNGVILKPVVPLRPAEVVNLYTSRQGAPKDTRQFSHEEYRALRESTDTFVDVAAVQF